MDAFSLCLQALQSIGAALLGRPWGGVPGGLEKVPGALDAALDASVLAQQFELELAMKDLSAALQLALRLVDLAPIRPEHRIRLARVAEWSGKPDMALAQWQVLAREAPASDAMDNALRLALALQNDVLWLALATQAVQHRPLKPRELAALATIQTRNSVDGPLIAFLHEYRKRYPLQLSQHLFTFCAAARPHTQAR